MLACVGAKQCLCRSQVIGAMKSFGWRSKTAKLKFSKLNRLLIDTKKNLISSYRKVPAACLAAWQALCVGARDAGTPGEPRISADELAVHPFGWQAEHVRTWIDAGSQATTRPQEMEHPTLGGGVTGQAFKSFYDFENADPHGDNVRCRNR